MQIRGKGFTCCSILWYAWPACFDIKADRGALVRTLVELLRNFALTFTSLCNASFGGDTRSHTGGKCVSCHGLHNSEINHFCDSPIISPIADVHICWEVYNTW